jgi:hypothetical protein
MFGARTSYNINNWQKNNAQTRALEENVFSNLPIGQVPRPLVQAKGNDLKLLKKQIAQKYISDY